jgi:hypothetical protein
LNKFKNNFYKIHLNIFIKVIEKQYNHLSTKYEDSVIEDTINNYKVFLKEFLNQSIHNSYNEFINKNPNIDNQYISFISDFYKTNIIVISNKLGYPYKNKNFHKRDTIFLLKLDNHFECLGFKKNENTLKCKFEYNSRNYNFIKKILKTSINVEIESEYNENDNESDNDSNSEHDSNSDYDSSDNESIKEEGYLSSSISDNDVSSSDEE